MSENTRFLTTREMAAFVRQSEETIRRRAGRGELPALRVGTGPRAPFRFDREEVERWLYFTGSRAASPFPPAKIPAARDGTAPAREKPQSGPSAHAGSRS
jgi:excisionase family DNA binding protein